MNICIVSHERFGANKGGVESVCYNLALEMMRKGGHTITHLYGSDSGTEDVPGVIACKLPKLTEPHAVDEVRSFLSEHRVDILWNHSPTAKLNPILRDATRGGRAKVVSIYHSSPYALFAELRERYALALYRARYKGEWLQLMKLLLKFPLSWLNTLHKTKRVFRSLAENSDLVCPLSEHYIGEFMRLIGRKYGHFRAVTNPLLSVVVENTHSTKKNQVVIVARHDWKPKRIDRAIRIWHKVAPQFPEWQLVILGDGPHRKDFEEVAERLRVKNIIFTGTQSPEPYYAESKLICLTSGWEGLPMVLLEAQQYGCVPIAYESFSALPDIITNGKTGFRIPPFREKIFIEKLTYLMTHEEERERMAQNCVLHSRNFKVSDIAEHWLNIFSNLLAPGSQG